MQTVIEKIKGLKLKRIGCACLLLALLNQVLCALGKSPLPIESETLNQLVTSGITVIAALVAWWKNNSFTKEAIAADKEYERLRSVSGK